MSNEGWKTPHDSTTSSESALAGTPDGKLNGTAIVPESNFKKEVPELTDQVGFGNATKKDALQGPETRLQWTKRVLTEGHTFPDAVLTVAAAQIGQVMLTMPNALYKTGLTAGLISALVSMALSVWTMYVLAALFLERKRDLIQKRQWYNADGVRSVVTQYHEVMGYHMGPVVRYIAQFVIALTLGGTGLAQIIACSGDVYIVHKQLSKRTWSLIWGAILMIFAFVPTFRHFRVLNVIALIGTTYTAFFIFITAVQHGRQPSFDPNRPPINAQSYFNGAAVLINALGGHSIALEMMDSMRNQKTFMGAFGCGWVWSLMLTIPQSIAANFAYPDHMAKNDNVFGIFPVTIQLQVGVWLMVVHQFVAFALYMTPLLYMVEKAVGVHEKRFPLRMLVRLPVALLIYLLGVMLPFYATINAVMGALGSPLIAFVIPALTFNKVFWKEESRAKAVYPPSWPFKLWNWKFAFGLNSVIFLGYLGFWGGALFYAIKGVVDNANTFGVFAECYQCPTGWQQKLQ